MREGENVTPADGDVLRAAPAFSLSRILAFSLLCISTLPLSAQDIPGFARHRADDQHRLESMLRAIPDPALIQGHVRTLAGRAHVAGTPAQTATADYVLGQMAAAGLDTSRAVYQVYLPFHDSTVVELVGARRQRLQLDEPAISGDPTTAQPRFPVINGYSGAGDVTAPVIYVNYGLAADYALLDSMGVDIRGKVVLARYGRSFRGIKLREAERNGAAALLLFSEPMDDGYFRGEVYPDGPMRNADGVQRGSVLNSAGDPSTPGWPSLPGAHRVPPDSMAVPRIPVVPIGYGNAAIILAAMHGPSVPEGWQGVLGFRYHLGDDQVRVRVAVWPERGERAFKRIENTLGTITGSDFPDEVVIIGAHRDAWGPGALDNVSGTVSVVEAARAWGEALRQGHRPRRTLVFATWDAEEWGLIGSTEWVQQHSDWLTDRAVAYINQDGVAGGRTFHASGSAALHSLMRDASAVVAQPGDTMTVYRGWQRGAARPTVGGMGGGSDFVGFHSTLGIPSLDWGFGGASGSYHSAYDTWTSMERFSDPGYLSHRANAQLAVTVMARLANADLLPYDYAALGEQVEQLVSSTREVPGTAAIRSDLDRVEQAGRAVGMMARRLELARNAVLWDSTAVDFAPVNRLLMSAERRLLDPAGLPGRPEYRHQVFAADRDNGYANVAFPAIIEALRDGDVTGAGEAARMVAERLRGVAAVMERAAEVLNGR